MGNRGSACQDPENDRQTIESNKLLQNRRTVRMKIITAQEAAAMVKDGDNIGVVTFGASGTPE